MSELAPQINELKTAEAFSRQSLMFDKIYGKNEMVQYKRERVRSHILKRLKNGSSMLELNCGTGEDAIFFAERGHTVHATDLSVGMLQYSEKKIQERKLSGAISLEVCSFAKLDTMKNRGPFDFIYSNFGGLNCTSNLDTVLQSLSSLLKPKGVVTLVILPKFTLWEFLLLFKGKFKTAFRRFFSHKGRKAHIEGAFFKCWYYNPSYIIHRMESEFDLIGLEGLCTLVPPSYMEGFDQKYPRLFCMLKAWENNWCAKWPWKYIGDYFILSLQKKN